uniref:Uncharacterized protein n=1 Tax=Panagrolaimus sp. ES5 TaxID=591445 RepID=A0AC34GS30_9BILA
MVVKLIAKDKNEKLQFEGKCKIKIDAVSKLLLVEPEIEEFKMISAMFTWNFVVQKNILFVFAEHNFQDFALIFDDSSKCKKVFDVLIHKKAVPGDKKLIQLRFLPLLFNEISKNDQPSFKLKEIFVDWIEKHDGKEKEEYIQLLKNNIFYDLIYPNDEYNYRRDFRKRKAEDIDDINVACGNHENISTGVGSALNEGQDCLKESLKKIKTAAKIYQKEDGTEFVMLNSKKHVCEPQKYDPRKYVEKKILNVDNFKIIKNIRNGMDRSKLVIFSSSDKTACYEYYWNNNDKKFCCCGCNIKKKHVTAEVGQYSNGSKYLKLSRTKHVCAPRKYDPTKFQMLNIIINSPNFKIFKYKHKGEMVSKLIIFCPSNTSLCYEFFWNKYAKYYQCSCCRFGKNVIATVSKNEDEKEYVALSKSQDTCKLREFNFEKYKDDIIVEKLFYNFIPVRNSERDVLVIFTNENKEFCYKFLYDRFSKCFYCSKCYNLKQKLPATVQNEGKENEFIAVKNQKHVCEPLKYSEVIKDFDHQIVASPNYQLIKRKVRGKIVQKMVVFTNDEKSECYEYTWNEKEKHFICWPCSNSYKIYVRAKIIKNDENDECVELGHNGHKCAPIKFVPENITPNIVKKSDFKLYEIVYQKKKIQNLTVFYSNDRKFGYNYSYDSQKKSYCCIKCRSKKKHVTAKLLQDENGQNYLELSKTEHVCEIQKL